MFLLKKGVLMLQKTLRLPLFGKYHANRLALLKTVCAVMTSALLIQAMAVEFNPIYARYLIVKNQAAVVKRMQPSQHFRQMTSPSTRGFSPCRGGKWKFLGLKA